MEVAGVLSNGLKRPRRWVSVPLDYLNTPLGSKEARLTPDTTLGTRVKGEAMTKWVHELMEERRQFWAGDNFREEAEEA